MNKVGQCYYRAKLCGRRVHDYCLHKRRVNSLCFHVLCPLKEGCKQLRLDLHDRENKCTECKLKDDNSACAHFVYLDQRIIMIKHLNRKLNEF